MFKFILLACLGILINFVSKYANSNSRIKDFSINFWAKDNWPELLIGLFATIALLMLLLDPQTTFDSDKIYQKLSNWIPWTEGVYIELRGVFALLIGLFCNHIVYWIMKKKVKTKTV